ncbi:MAG: extracellular solute-binding protein [Candidatus Paceibacterota bacterium]
MFSKSQLIILGIGFLVVFIFILVLLGVIPGLRSDIGTKVNLVVWGVRDSSENFASGIKEFQTLYPTVSVSYEKKDQATYEADLLNALALGTGPDVIMIENTWLPRYINKLSPASAETIDINSLRELFPLVVEQDFTSGGNIFALPLFVDTLSLFYNKDLFDSANIISPPENWDVFKDDVNKLKKVDKKGNIERAGVALGGSLKSVNRASDIVYLLMMQSGVKMISSDYNRASFTGTFEDKNPGVSALEFYTSFANPKSSAYSWNDSFGTSLDSFAEGKTAMILGYSWMMEEIKNRNPFLDFAVAKVPQLSASEIPVNFSDYRGLAVLKQSLNKTEAWNFVSFITGTESSARSFYLSTNHPPALRSLLPECQNSETISAFCRQTLSARSWPQVDKPKIDAIFSDTIKDILSGQLSVIESLKKAEDQVSLLISESKK